MAELEAEAMLLGIWKNFTELEENMNLDELNAVLKAAHKKEQNHQRFLAAMKGIKLDTDAEERFQAVKQRAETRLAGVTIGGEEHERKTEADELAAFGFEVETDE